MQKLLIALSLLLGCKASDTQDEKFSFQRSTITSKALKLNGYYYCYYNNKSQKKVYFLYENGLFIDIETFDNKTFEEIETYCQSEFFLTQKLNVQKRMYGIFKIENYSLFIDRWFPYRTILGVANYNCTILNDSTFQIIQKNSSGKTTDITSENQIYHFRPYTPKPDSNNNFIP